MIDPRDLIARAVAVFEDRGHVDEVACRRAISAAYYGLFHVLTEAAARVVGADDDALVAGLVRAYEHKVLRRVCEDLLKRPDRRQFQALLARDPSGELQLVARAFTQLQAARLDADYDLHAPIGRSFAQAHVQLAQEAAVAFEAVRGSAEARRFLIALLVSDRLKQRG